MYIDEDDIISEDLHFKNLKEWPKHIKVFNFCRKQSCINGPLREKAKVEGVGDGGMWRGLGVMPAAVLGYCVTLIKPTLSTSSPYKRPQITASPSSFITPWGSKRQLSLSSRKPPAHLHTYETKHAHSSEPSHVPSNTLATVSTDHKTSHIHTLTHMRVPTANNGS